MKITFTGGIWRRKEVGKELRGGEGGEAVCEWAIYCIRELKVHILEIYIYPILDYIIHIILSIICILYCFCYI